MPPTDLAPRWDRPSLHETALIFTNEISYKYPLNIRRRVDIAWRQGTEVLAISRREIFHEAFNFIVMVICYHGRGI